MLFAVLPPTTALGHHTSNHLNPHLLLDRRQVGKLMHVIPALLPLIALLIASPRAHAPGGSGRGCPASSRRLTSPHSARPASAALQSSSQNSAAKPARPPVSSAMNRPPAATPSAVRARPRS